MKICAFLGIFLLTTQTVLAVRDDVFSRTLFTNIVQSRSTQNVFFSPFSVETMLAMVYVGSGGETEKEIRSTIGFDGANQEQAALEYGSLIKNSLKTAKPDGAQFHIANRLYVNEGVSVKSDYAQTIGQHFGAIPETVAFADAGKTVHHINSWVEEQTHNKIKNLVSPSDVDGNTAAILINALHFKAPWAMPFPEHATHKGEFHVSPSQTVSVDFMRNEADFLYGEFPSFDAKAVILPYANLGQVMMLLVPNQVDGLADLEQKLSTATLAVINRGVQRTKLDFIMPKFEFEFDIKLKEPLEKMGLKTLLSDAADFSGIFEEPHKISSVVHKAVISVNEHGTEAAAATAANFAPFSAHVELSTPTEFHVDRPFAFVIFGRDGNIYFVGHLAKF